MIINSVKRKIVLLFILMLMSDSKTALSGEFSVPNGGSPYLHLSKLAPDEILHVPTGIKISEEELMNNLFSSKVIYVAETHDNLESHRVQLNVIKAFLEKFPGQIAVGMEMFRKPAQEKLNEWLKGNLNQHDFFNMWHENWGEGYDNYRDIMEFIKSNSIPLIALKPSKVLEHNLRSKGADALSEQEKKDLPELYEGDEYHKVFADSVFGAHGKNSHVVLHSPYRTLLLWEETMADVISKFVNSEDGKDKKLIVLTGGFHVEYGFGVPKRAYRRTPAKYSIVLPKVTRVPKNLRPGVIMDVKPVHIPLYIADYVWSVNYKFLEDTQIMLGVSITPAKDKGLKVLSVNVDSNAQNAGILAGDLLLTMDDSPINNIYELKSLLKGVKADDESELKIIREDKELNIKVKFK